MNLLARMLLRPALWAGLAGVEARTTAATCVSAVSRCPRAAFIVTRPWSSSAPSEEALRKAERMVELMGQSPQLQQMIMNVIPSPLRSPDMVKQMFADPAMRRRMAEMIAARGFNIPDHMLDRMTAGAMGDTFARAQRLGLDPSRMFAQLMAHPGLLSKLQQPRVMAAFLDLAEDPSRQAKYEDDKELLEVVFKAREILGSAKAPPTPPSTSSTEGVISLPADSSADAAASSAAAGAAGAADAAGAVTSPDAGDRAGGAAAGPGPLQPPPPGQPPRLDAVAGSPQDGPADAAGSSSSSSDSSGAGDTTSTTSTWSGEGSSASHNPLVALMRSDPKAARWLDNPKVMAALEEVSKSPWKTVKYIFNRDVMEAFNDLSKLMRGKTP